MLLSDTTLTKELLAQSMKKLMKKKSFDKISVIDICEGCGMNRKSFYYHFKDKYDLVNWIFYSGFILLTTQRRYENGWDLLVAVSELFKKDKVFYRRAMEIEGQNCFRDFFCESTTPIFSLFLKELSDDEILQEKGIPYMTDAFLAVMKRWLIDGGDQTPEEFVSNLRVVLTGIGKVADKKFPV